MRRLAPTYLTNLGWHVAPHSALIGNSNEAASFFRNVDGGLDLSDLEDTWKLALEEGSALAKICRGTLPRLTGTFENPDKNPLIQQLLNDEDTENDIGTTGKPLRGLSAAQIRSFAGHLARFSLFLNNRYKHDFTKSKNAATELPFPASLKSMDDKVKVNHLYTLLYHIEFDNNSREDGAGASKDKVIIGEMSRFIWAYTLEFENGKVSGYRAPSTVARALNALIASLKYCILFFRCKDKDTATINSKKLVFQGADSTSILTTVRASIGDELGKERSDRVRQNITETNLKGFAVVTVSPAGEQARDFTALDIGAGYNRALADLVSLCKDSLKTLGLDDSLATRLTNYMDSEIKFDTASGDIASLSLPFDTIKSSADLIECLSQAVEDLQGDARISLKSNLYRIQRALLYCVYFSFLGSSRSTDLYYVSRLSKGHDAAAHCVLVESQATPIDVYHCHAYNAHELELVMGNYKKKEANSVRGINRSIDRGTSRFLSLFCILRLALPDLADPSDFDGVWMYPSRDSLRDDFPVACKQYLDFNLLLSDARQVRHLEGGRGRERNGNA